MKNIIDNLKKNEKCLQGVLAGSSIEEKKSVINFRDESGNSALILAAYYDEPSKVELLIDMMRTLGMNDTQLLEALDQHNHYGRNALMNSAWTGHAKMVRALLDIMKTLGMPEQLFSALNHKDNDGYSALMLAACCEEADIVQAILSTMTTLDMNDAQWLAILNQKDHYGRSALMNGNISIVQSILSFVSSTKDKFDLLISDGVLEKLINTVNENEEKSSKLKLFIESLISEGVPITAEHLTGLKFDIDVVGYKSIRLSKFRLMRQALKKSYIIEAVILLMVPFQVGSWNGEISFDGWISIGSCILCFLLKM